MQQTLAQIKFERGKLDGLFFQIPNRSGIWKTVFEGDHCVTMERLSNNKNRESEPITDIFHLSEKATLHDDKKGV